MLQPNVTTAMFWVAWGWAKKVELFDSLLIKDNVITITIILTQGGGIVYKATR